MKKHRHTDIGNNPCQKAAKKDELLKDALPFQGIYPKECICINFLKFTFLSICAIALPPYNIREITESVPFTNPEITMGVMDA